MKVLLVRVPIESCEVMKYQTFSYFAEPTGLHYIAEALSQEAIDVMIHDMFLDADPDTLMEVIAEYRPVIVGFGSLILGYDNVGMLAGVIKQKYPEIKVVVGGPCTFMPSQVMMQHELAIDYIIKGEGEEAFTRLVKSCLSGLPDKLPTIEGLAYRVNGQVVENLKLHYIDPATLHFPIERFKDYNDAMNGSIMTLMMGDPPIAFIEASRGCKFRCSFCGVHEPFRTRPPEIVVDELAQLNSRYGVKKFVFADYSFTADSAHAETLCNLILDRGLKIEWACDTRVDCVSLPLLKLMKKAGCRVIFYGIESFFQETLDTFNKGTNVTFIKDAIKNTRKAGIQSLAYMMLGAPGETREMIMKNSWTLNVLGVDYALCGITRLFSGTRLFDQAVNNGIIDRDYGEKCCLSGDIDRMPVYDDTLTYWEMKELEMEVVRRFYFRAGYVIRRILSVRNFSELQRVVKYLLQFTIKKTARAC
ncbi:MAG: radical SAM protein [Desulfuromonadaceae bacterium]|nr:radical SAM protein [Desulfuromonadaceae bacterium]